MIAALLLAAQAPAPPAAQAASPAAPPATVPPLATWPALPPYPLPRRASVADAPLYVRAEVEAKRCPVAAPAGPDDAGIVVTAAILVGPGGVVRRIVPQAIGCPTVEQFTVGYLSSLMRGSGDATPSPPPGWYRATMIYRL